MKHAGPCNLLMLVHRIPFPPDKGDKIRSYHLLRHLAARHRVHLGAFVDDPADLVHESALRAICPDLRLFPIDPRKRKLASLLGLLTGDALSVRYYRDPRVSDWIASLRARERFDAVVTCSSTTAQFVEGDDWASIPRVADFIDVDSEKWRQYASTASPPMSWVYAREARALLSFERRIASAFTRTLFVSEAEAALFARRAPEAAARVGYYSNGVDTDYFDPAADLPDPYPPGGPVVVFTGAMDYRPNVEAVTWYADEILPRVLAQRPDSRFWIVGSKPARSVRQLAERKGVTVTGRVPDVRAYLKHASVAVAPLRIARGIQNKVLEALAMAKPVVCTRSAAEGIDPSGGAVAGIADDAEGFAAATLRSMGHADRTAARKLVVERFSWDSHLRVVDELIASAIASDPGRSA